MRILLESAVQLQYVRKEQSHKPHYSFFLLLFLLSLSLFSRVCTLLLKHLNIITELTQMEAITLLLKYFLEKGGVLTRQTVGCNHDLIEVHVTLRSARCCHSRGVGWQPYRKRQWGTCWQICFSTL